jgi:outer membrane protein assembly factor BamB
VVLDGDRVLATTKGELFCLEAATGQLLWRNELKGMGRGLVSIATANSPTGSALLPAEKKRRDEQAAAAGAAASAH